MKRRKPEVRHFNTQSASPEGSALPRAKGRLKLICQRKIEVVVSKRRSAQHAKVEERDDDHAAEA
jgi:hypothetical protein